MKSLSGSSQFHVPSYSMLGKPWAWKKQAAGHLMPGKCWENLGFCPNTPLEPVCGLCWISHSLVSYLFLWLLQGLPHTFTPSSPAPSSLIGILNSSMWVTPGDPLRRTLRKLQLRQHLALYCHGTNAPTLWFQGLEKEFAGRGCWSVSFQWLD